MSKMFKDASFSGKTNSAGRFTASPSACNQAPSPNHKIISKYTFIYGFPLAAGSIQYTANCEPLLYSPAQYRLKTTQRSYLGIQAIPRDNVWW